MLRSKGRDSIEMALSVAGIFSSISLLQSKGRDSIEMYNALFSLISSFFEEISIQKASQVGQDLERGGSLGVAGAVLSLTGTSTPFAGEHRSGRVTRAAVAGA